MKVAVVLAALLSAANAINGVDFEDTKIFESLRGVPQGWAPSGKPDAGARMRFRIALKMVSECLWSG